MKENDKEAKKEINRLCEEQYEIQPFDVEYEESIRKVEAEAAKKEPLNDEQKLVEQMLVYHKVRILDR